MAIDSWVIIVDENRAGGMLDAARRLGGRVTAAVAGKRDLAERAADMGFDQVLCWETADGVPAEAYAAALAERAAQDAPRLVLASDAPPARVLLGAAAAALNAAVVASVRAVAAAEENIVVSRAAAEGKVLEDIAVSGALAGIFDGDDAEQRGDAAVTVEIVPAEAGAALRVLSTEAESGAAGLLTAARVVGVGMGLRARDDLRIVEDLAAVLGAETACTLPVCDDMRWFAAHSVVGSSHSRIAPTLYIALGISGQPQHMSGVRDAKVVVAVNSDPEARIFKNCDYGIVGDLYKIVPELTAAFAATKNP
ncbi:MAG: electron transfer flavoprotein subunit alpha/FixB family protein [Gracilibacteraceae bacterium]|jgi:electron transfer flavoprotein alpha subunit|nr:electron transfer flavoprotein subunit alpha/FixB family protein [Gracilibacteraceae bacterium]